MVELMYIVWSIFILWVIACTTVNWLSQIKILQFMVYWRGFICLLGKIWVVAILEFLVIAIITIFLWKRILKGVLLTCESSLLGLIKITSQSLNFTSWMSCSIWRLAWVVRIINIIVFTSSECLFKWRVTFFIILNYVIRFEHLFDECFWFYI